MKKILIITLVIFAASSIFSACIFTSEKALYQGKMIDAHAHFKSNILNIDELINIIDQAKIEQIVLFVKAKEAKEINKKYPDKTILFLDPFKKDSETKKLIVTEDSPKEIEEQLKRGIYSGIGELTLRLHPLPNVSPEGENIPIDSPTMLEIYDIAAKYNVPVNVHSDLEYKDELERALEHNRSTKIIWAHCGYAEPDVIAEMLDKHPNLYADLTIVLDSTKWKYAASYKELDGSLKPEWKDLLEKYSDRLMFGTDMGMNKERYEQTPEITDSYRAILGQLSSEAAENIAYKTILELTEK